jgi:hypothetical protein
VANCAIVASSVAPAQPSERACLLSRGRERDLPGSQAIRPVPLPRSRTPGRIGDALPHYGFADAAPRSLQSEGFSVMEISGLPRGFSTCCLRFTSGVATTHARLASGGQARLYRKGVEPSGSLQKVSDHSFSSSGFILAQEGPSFISRTVTHRRLDRCYSCHTTRSRHRRNPMD